MDGQLGVLVTGASSGIGRSTAMELARRGHLVFAAARRADALAALAATSPGIRAITLDVTDADSVRRAWEEIVAQTGGTGVDVLVNNAGFALLGPVETFSDADVQRQFATNVFGLLAMTRAVLPAMRARGSGRIINVSSVVGRMTIPGMGLYGASKHAVEAVSDALRQELAGYGIQVVVVEPGFVATPIAEAADAQSATSEEVSAAYEEMISTGGRYFAHGIANGIAPELVAAAIAKAAGHRHPRARYVVPASARPQLALLRSMPDRASDKAKQRAIAAYARS